MESDVPLSLLLKDLLLMAENRFRDTGCPDPRLDAEILLCHLLQVDKSYLFTHYGDDLQDEPCQGYFDLMDRRASGEPVQYITGIQDFMGLTFKVNESVLIPRQDTETLAEAAEEELMRRKQPLGGFDVLDLCCGSGAIGIALASRVGKQKKMKVVASDISREALAVAEENASLNGVKGKVQFVESDLFAAFPKDRKGKGKRRFDLILSNPPYIPSEVLPTLQREIREHEPMLALDGGPKGLDFYARILEEAPDFLKPGGMVILEMGYDQGDGLAALAEEKGGYSLPHIIKDLAGKERVFAVGYHG